MRNSSRFRNLLLYLLFVGVATVFWLIIAMNDNVQKHLDVNITISDKPDSITFITLPPSHIHVTVRDRGTRLYRAIMTKNLNIDFNFKEFSNNGVFRVTTSDIFAALRAKIGSEAQINAISIDSINLPYTLLAGKKVPIEIISELTASNGFVVMPQLEPSKKIVTIYSANQNVLDTIHKIKTEKIIQNNLSKTITLKASFVKIPNVRISPENVNVTIPVEPLVNKKITKEIKVIGVPKNENVLLFPTTATVSIFVPMSKFNDDVNVSLEVNYNQIRERSRKLAINIENVPFYGINPTIAPDSVEYTLVR